MGEKLSIDEVSLSDGELYTILSNKLGFGKNGTLISVIKGTKSETIIHVLDKICSNKRSLVKEVSLDMAKNMEASVKQCFSNAKLVTDRFHVVRLVLEALQQLRVQYRWDEMDKENERIKDFRSIGVRYNPNLFENGDTAKQLLARSRYILAKKKEKWTENQKERAEILFLQYPLLEKAYKHVMEFRNIYEVNCAINAKQKIKNWIAKTPDLGIKQFTSVTYTISQNLEQIVNFFQNRSTNASAESFNAKIKLNAYRKLYHKLK